MGKKSNKALRKANGYAYNTEDSLKKLKDELVVPVKETKESGPFRVMGAIKANKRF